MNVVILFNLISRLRNTNNLNTSYSITSNSSGTSQPRFEQIDRHTERQTEGQTDMMTYNLNTSYSVTSNSSGASQPRCEQIDRQTDRHETEKTDRQAKR